MDLNTIIRYIESEKCVLLVGSELPFLTSKLNRQQAIWNCLTKDGAPDLIQFKEDDFYYFPHQTQRLKACGKLIELYDSLHINDLYRKIAQIPFSLIISLSPDNLLKRTHIELFGENSFDFGYYKGLENREFKCSPSKARPAIYNLFGDISQDDDSTILTFDDLFNFFASIFGNFQLHIDIKSKLKGAKSFVFIGFKFNAWYYKLLLRILEIDDQKLTYYYPDETIGDRDEIEKEDKVLLFFDKHFKMDFSPFNVEQFVNELFSQCYNRKIIRTKLLLHPFDNLRFKTLIGKNLLEDAIKDASYYLQLTKNNKQINTLSSISNDFNNYKNTYLRGILTSEESERRRLIIIDKLLELGDNLIN